MGVPAVEVFKKFWQVRLIIKSGFIKTSHGSGMNKPDVPLFCLPFASLVLFGMQQGALTGNDVNLTGCT